MIVKDNVQTVSRQIFDDRDNMLAKADHILSTTPYLVRSEKVPHVGGTKWRLYIGVEL